MNKELIDYLIAHYSDLLSFIEKAAQRHYLASVKSENAKDSRLKEVILNRWGTNDEEILALLENGYEEFKRVAAEKIAREQGDKIILNNCPNCGRLARTPLARQCRHCGNNWH